ncbi:hypothetical protein CDL12_28541 [Handroanthus impetiginosus]|uniref:NAB domain-containing protein n=1 Tax=Handroanthus impetiginosus TaxID=429701 RepID=A0A2G9G0Z4_9LAMI|nr:hypothetical protein CDL12_28541 [Handroanthus impetiginosus]
MVFSTASTPFSTKMQKLEAKDLPNTISSFINSCHICCVPRAISTSKRYYNNIHQTADMEEKVQNMLKLIEEDGDSFAKRAEMYYKRRPELINSVEETYRAFKALADRYDLLSKELQNANHTIATVFPEQVQFSMDEDDDLPTPKLPKNVQNPANVPKVPKAPIENLKGLISTASKQFQAKKAPKPPAKNKVVVKSGLNKEEALGEIDKLHKEILGLQTVKEFVKSSYESGLAKYWELENQIMELQDKVCRLQDEFDVEAVIEDNEARTLMAEAALKSCQETLAILQEKQEKSTREAQEEFKKIEAARQLLKSLRKEYMKEQMDEQKPSEDEKAAKAGDESEMLAKDVSDLIQESKEIDPVQEKNDLGSMATLTVTELAEKIDELVNKVISLETAVSSQTVLINALRTEADDLHAQIKNLEDEKETLIGDTHNLSKRLKEMEEKLNRIQDLNKNVESQSSNLQSNFAEARSSLDHLSEKLSTVKPDEEVEETNSSPDEPKSSSEHKLSEQKLPEEIKDQKDVQSPGEIETSSGTSKTEDVKDVKEVQITVQTSELPPVPKEEEEKKPAKKTVTFLDEKPKELTPADRSDEPVKAEEQGNQTAKEDDLSWQQMLLSGTEDREKILLKEYTTILRNYKDVKKKLSDTEKKEKESQFDITLQMSELKEAIIKRDHEIHLLRHKLSLLQGNKDVKEEGSQTSDSSGDRSVKPESGSEDLNISVINKDDEIKMVHIDTTPTISAVEEKLRMAIDAILDENLDFWLRFSTSFHQVQKFKSEVQDLQDEISKLKEKKKQDGSISTQLKSEARPIYKHLREIQTELTVWLEQSASLKDELKRRSASLCSIQEEITVALKEGVEEEEIRFSTHQAAKLQGEVLNMKQENNKVKEELQACLDHVSTLQLEIEKTLRQLNEEFGISSDQPQLQHTMSRSRVPLRSFIFGTRAKKQKHSLFSFMHPNRKFHVVRAGVPLSNN